jgi:predicted nucleic acid-binding Zn ribbon protein
VDPAPVDPAPAAGGPAGPRPPGAAADLTGPELARAALEAARARRQGPAPRRGTGPDAPAGGAAGDDASPGGAGRRRAGRRGYTGAGPDPRDPQPLGAVIDQLLRNRGWQRPAAQAAVFGAWEKMVGHDVAAHCRPVRLDAGELTVEAESTAWATQLRLLAANLLVRIAAEAGPNVVTKLHIHGPTAPSWQRGPLRVRGRGPRDTYG